MRCLCQLREAGVETGGKLFAVVFVSRGKAGRFVVLRG